MIPPKDNFFLFFCSLTSIFLFICTCFSQEIFVANIANVCLF